MKGTIPLDAIDAAALTDYAGIVGHLLAKGHARTSGASMIAGYARRLRQARPGDGTVRPRVRRPDRGRPRRAGRGASSAARCRYGGCAGSGPVRLSGPDGLADRRLDHRSGPTGRLRRAPPGKRDDGEGADAQERATAGDHEPRVTHRRRSWLSPPDRRLRSVAWAPGTQARCRGLRQVAVAQSRSTNRSTALSPFALDGVGREDHPGAADVWDPRPQLLVMSVDATTCSRTPRPCTPVDPEPMSVRAGFRRRPMSVLA